MLFVSNRFRLEFIWASDGIGRRTRLKISGAYARVGSSPTSPTMTTRKMLLSYVIGVACGDGNLSNPNGRAFRLRITCDKKYPAIIKTTRNAISFLLPNNKVGLVHRPDNCIDISSYSNKWPELLGWTSEGGSKYQKNIGIPHWIKCNKRYTRACLRGLIETDGSIYYDRGYLMVNFVTIILRLAYDTEKMITDIGFTCHSYYIKSKKKNRRDRYNIRISKNVSDFIEVINCKKH